jgi:hypothetical protein
MALHFVPAYEFDNATGFFKEKPRNLCYVYDKTEKLFYALHVHWLTEQNVNFVVIGPVNGEPSQANLAYHLVAKGWPPNKPFPPLSEDPIPF